MKKVAVLVENKFEEPELIYPYWRLKEDYEVVLVGTQADTEYVGKAGNIITARTPDDLPAHIKKFVEELGK